MSYYEALFRKEPEASIWEGVEERFSPQISKHSSLNVHSLARAKLYEALLPQGSLIEARKEEKQV